MMSSDKLLPTTLYVVVTAAGNFNWDFCDFSPSSSPDVINVGAIQEAEDPGSRTRV